jgi:hypothetical protein
MLGAALEAGPTARTAENRGTGATAAQPASPDHGSAGRISALREHARTLEAQFVARFRALLTAHSIEPGSTVRLGLDEFGNVRAVGSHPQAASIDHALADDPDLSGLFQELAAIDEALRAAARPLASLPLSLPGQWESGVGRGSAGFVLTIPPEPAIDREFTGLNF